MSYKVSASCQIPNLGSVFEGFFGFPSVGTFVEVGAYDGESWSNTSCLADHGWTGIYIEPQPEFAAKCAVRHSLNPGVQVVCSACSSDGGLLDLAVSERPYLATASAEGLIAAQSVFGIDRHSIRTVPSVRLDTLLDHFGVKAGFELLVIDVEGYERQVFDGFSLSEWVPQVLVVELVDHHPDFKAHSHSVSESEHIRQKIIEMGYHEVFVDCINTIFARSKAS